MSLSQSYEEEDSYHKVELPEVLSLTSVSSVFHNECVPKTFFPVPAAILADIALLTVLFSLPTPCEREQVWSQSSTAPLPRPLLCYCVPHLSKLALDSILQSSIYNRLSPFSSKPVLFSSSLVGLTIMHYNFNFYD